MNLLGLWLALYLGPLYAALDVEDRALVAVAVETLTPWSVDRDEGLTTEILRLQVRIRDRRAAWE